MAPPTAATADQQHSVRVGADSFDVPPSRGSRAENLTQIVIMLTIGGAAGAASFTHVHNVAASHGQDGWLAWADAIVLELMSIAAGLELRYRKRQHASTRFPAIILMCAVTLSIAAQVVEAEQSVIGWIAAALPALGFLVMTKIALNRAAMPRPHRGAPVPTGSGDGPVVAGRGARPRRSPKIVPVARGTIMDALVASPHGKTGTGPAAQRRSPHAAKRRRTPRWTISYRSLGPRGKHWSAKVCR